MKIEIFFIHYLVEIFLIFGDMWIKIQGRVYTEGDIHLENICLMKNLLNFKKVKDGVSKEYIIIYIYITKFYYNLWQNINWHLMMAFI